MSDLFPVPGEIVAVGNLLKRTAECEHCGAPILSALEYDRPMTLQQHLDREFLRRMMEPYIRSMRYPRQEQP